MPNALFSGDRQGLSQVGSPGKGREVREVLLFPLNSASKFDPKNGTSLFF